MWQKCMCKLFSVAPTQLSAVVRSLQRKFSFFTIFFIFFLISESASCWSGLLQQLWVYPLEVLKSKLVTSVGMYESINKVNSLESFFQWNMHDENVSKSSHKGCFWLWKMFFMDKFFCWINLTIFKLCISFGNECILVTWEKQWI